MTEKRFDFEYGSNGEPIEGFLGDGAESKILFILREPHSGDQQEFWMKRSIDDDFDPETGAYYRKKDNLIYANICASIASFVLKTAQDERRDDLSAIRSSAYINLFARHGESEKSRYFTNTLSYLDKLLCGEELSEDECEAESFERAHRVYGLLSDFLHHDTEYIVTVDDIYCHLSKHSVREEPSWLTIPDAYRPRATKAQKAAGVIREKLPLELRACRIKLFGKEVYLLEFRHPSNYTYPFSKYKKAMPDHYVCIEPHNGG